MGRRTPLSMLVVATCLVLAGLISPSVAAQENETAKPSRKPRIPSAVERQDKQATWNAEVIGLFAARHVGFFTGASGGVFLNPDLVLRASYRSAKSCVDERCSNVYDAASITLQAFVANSFFVEGGLIRQQLIAHEVAASSYSYDYNARRSAFTYEVENYGAFVGIGNQWQFRNFTIGARWFALGMPRLTTKARIKAELPERYQIGDEERETLDDMQTTTAVFLPTLMIGTSF